MSNTDNKRLFNIDLLIPDRKITQLLGEITTLAIFENNSKTFNQFGLFSTSIFGELGNDVRLVKFGYIDLKIKVLHPLIYQHVCSLSSIHEGIFKGTTYAEFDNETNMFKTSDRTSGSTGYEFFIKHIDKLQYRETDSVQRKIKIKLVKKYANTQHLLNAFLVLPAGLREYVVDDNGSPSEDEINKFYRKILATANTLSNTNVDKNISMLDSLRYNLQISICSVYDYISDTLLDGKNKYVQGKFAKRGMAFGTRNVITPGTQFIKRLDDPNNIKPNQSVIGVYQLAASLLPIVKNMINRVVTSKFFSSTTTSAILVNPLSLTTNTIEIKTKYRDEWTTTAGLDNIINMLKHEDTRLSPVMVGDQYLCLLYDNGSTVELIYDTRSLDETYDTKLLRPITYLELLYIVLVTVYKNYPGLLTRYPAIEEGSVFPTYWYLKSTTVGREVTLIVPGLGNLMVNEYPVLTEEPFMSMSLHVAHLARAGADFDGDKMGGVTLYTDDAINEIKAFFGNTLNYVTASGEIVYSNSNPVNELVMAYLTGTTDAN